MSMAWMQSTGCKSLAVRLNPGQIPFSLTHIELQSAENTFLPLQVTSGFQHRSGG